MVSFELYFTCMKNSTTRVILVQAMASAITGFQTPRSTYDAQTVSAVPQQQREKDDHIDHGAYDVMRVFAVLCSVRSCRCVLHWCLLIR